MFLVTSSLSYPTISRSGDGLGVVKRAELGICAVRHYNPSSLISLAWRGIRQLGKLNPQFRDLCKARAFSGLDE